MLIKYLANEIAAKASGQRRFSAAPVTKELGTERKMRTSRDEIILPAECTLWNSTVTPTEKGDCTFNRLSCRSCPCRRASWIPDSPDRDELRLRNKFRIATSHRLFAENRENPSARIAIETCHSIGRSGEFVAPPEFRGCSSSLRFYAVYLFNSRQLCARNRSNNVSVWAGSHVDHYLCKHR